MQLSENPTSKGWYTRFALGMHKRMGDNPKPDMAISIDVMHAMMERLEIKWQGAKARGDDEEADHVMFAALFAVVAFCGALRGEEVPLMNLRECMRLHPKGMAETGERRHTVVALRGRFKNEVGEQCHLVPLAAVTRTGLKPGRWMQRMINSYADKGIRTGPVFRRCFKSLIDSGLIVKDGDRYRKTNEIAELF